LLALLALDGGSTPAQAPVAELKRLPNLDLRPPSPWLDLASAGDWIPYGDGVALLAWHGTLAEYEPWLCVYGGDGALQHKIRLPAREGEPIGSLGLLAGSPNRICVLGEHEIGVIPWRTGEHEFVGVRVDLEHEASSPWPMPIQFDSSSECKALPGGDLLELQVQRTDRTPGLRRLAPDGAVRWKLDRSSGLWADGGLVLASDGRILAWNVQDPPAIQVVLPEGRVARTVLLKEIVPLASYIHGLAAAAHGECYLDVGLQEQRRIVHTDAELHPLDTFVPHFSDGSKEYRSIHSASDGRLWVYDGFCFARLDVRGSPEHILGPPPGTALLQSARPVHITNDGRIFAFSDRDGRLFELDASAKVLKAFEPCEHASPFGFEDIEWQMAPLDLATRYRAYSFDEGRRLWRVEGGRARLLRTDGSDLSSVALFPPEAKDAEARGLAVSRAGLFVLLLTRGATRELAVIDAQGKLRLRVSVELEQVRRASIDEQHLALTTMSTVELYDMRGQHVGHAALSSDGRPDIPDCGMQPESMWRVDLRSESKELWLRQGPNTLIVRRYALP
jgi:hypothetical protein